MAPKIKRGSARQAEAEAREAEDLKAGGKRADEGTESAEARERVRAASHLPLRLHPHASPCDGA